MAEECNMPLNEYAAISGKTYLLVRQIFYSCKDQMEGHYIVDAKKSIHIDKIGASILDTYSLPSIPEEFKTTNAELAKRFDISVTRINEKIRSLNLRDENHAIKIGQRTYIDDYGVEQLANSFNSTKANNHFSNYKKELERQIAVLQSQNKELSEQLAVLRLSNEQMVAKLNYLELYVKSKLK